jgi:hypothetical protein
MSGFFWFHGFLLNHVGLGWDAAPLRGVAKLDWSGLVRPN